jgi:hypothetical protein
MIRNPRRVVVAVAVSVLVAGGGVTAGLAASAGVVLQTCNASADVSVATCTIPTQTITYPAAMQIDIEIPTGGAAQDVNVTWSGYCAQGSHKAVITSPLNGMTVAVPPTTAIKVPLPYTVPDYCDVSTTATLNGTGTLEMTLEYTPGTPANPSPPAAVPLIKGYGGKCLDDRQNSSANRTEVILWTCNSADPAQGWKFTNGELVHNGKCANDQANGGSGTKVILWTCNRAPDETWTHTGSDGEFVLASRTHGLLCLDDPRSSTANRTQLIVYTCHNTSNQHWT